MDEPLAPLVDPTGSLQEVDEGQYDLVLTFPQAMKPGPVLNMPDYEGSTIGGIMKTPAGYTWASATVLRLHYVAQGSPSYPVLLTYQQTGDYQPETVTGRKYTLFENVSCNE